MDYQDGRRPSAADGIRAAAEMTPIGALPDHLDIGGKFRDTSRALALLKELGPEVTEDSLALMPVFLSFLKHDAHVVVRQSIATGTNLFHVVLEEMALQLHKSGKVERWLEETWDWMVKFKDAMYVILSSEPGPVGIKMLAVKFLEICVLLFTSDANNIELPCTEGKGRKFNVSWLAEGDPILNPALLASEANKTLTFLFDILQSSTNLRGSFTIVVINCLSAIARHRPLYYSCILSMLLDFDPKFETLKGGHAASIRYSLRTSLLGFLKCTHPQIIESRDKLLKALRAINPGEATEQIIRRLGKMSKSAEHISQDVRLRKNDPPSGQIFPCGDMIRKRHMVQAKDCPTVADAMSALPAETDSDFVQDDDDDGVDAINGLSLRTSVMGGNLTEVEKMMAMIGALLAEGERATESLEILISNIHADLMADIVMENMKHLPKNPLPISGRYGNLPRNSPISSSSSSPQVGSAASATVPVQYSALPTQVALTDANATNAIETNRDGNGCSARVSSPLTG